MDTKYYRLTNQSSDKEIYQEAGRIIRAGGLVAFPTETVYGLGGDAENPLASRKIYEAKGRPSDNPLIVHIAEISQLKEIASHLPKEAEKLAEAFWPGPLTMIVDKNDRIPLETTGGLQTVAVRMPSHPAAREFIRVSGRMIAAPSANTSGRPSPHQSGTRAAGSGRQDRHDSGRRAGWDRTGIHDCGSHRGDADHSAPRIHYREDAHRGAGRSAG